MKTLNFIFLSMLFPLGIFAQNNEGSSKPQSFHMVKKDLSGPKIFITEPELSRGVKILNDLKAITVKGYVEDESGIQNVKINNVPVTITQDGKFETLLHLTEGSNIILIQSTDKKQNLSEYSFTLNNSSKSGTTYSSENESRVALIIGNSNYAGSPLKNPTNDAKTIAQELKQINFDVNVVTNASYQEMKKAISEFGKKLSLNKNTVGLFYYAGHGIQIKGKNYLVPTDAAIEGEADVEVYAVDMEGLLSNLEFANNRMNIIIMDACRNNPFGRSFRSAAGNGLATVNAPTGTIIAYATSPGSTAADGTGNNGLYTQEFVKALKTPGLQIEEVFKKVRTQVKELSGGKQIPWENSALEGNFYFVK